VPEPHITPWRRAVTGDLTSVFDFTAPDRAADAALPDASRLPARAMARASLPTPTPPASPAPMPRQEPGARPARALPYAFDAWARRSTDGLDLTIANFGAAGAGFSVYPEARDGPGPWYYAVEAGQRLADRLPAGPDGYDLTLHGPNGFLRRFRGGAAESLAVSHRYDAARRRVEIVVSNQAGRPVVVRTADAYAAAGPRTLRLAAGAEVVDAWRIDASGCWYDVSITVADDPTYLRRIAGHIETGRPSRSDPALDWASA